MARSSSSRRRRSQSPITKNGRRSSPATRRVFGVFLSICTMGAGLMGALTAYAALTLPDVNTIGAHTGTITITDRNGQVIGQVGLEGNARTPVSINKVAIVMQHAIVAAEDKNFYSEGAFDVPRIMKALIVDVILRQPAQGASTITQQLAKQAFFGAQAEKSPLRKLREALLANELNTKYSKQQILEMYLNVTYFGENAFGIEDASERYFGKHASQLNLQEAAMLAGLPQAPSGDDPYANPQNAFHRTHYVLGQMVDDGYASQTDAQNADPLNPDGTDNHAHQQALLNDLKHGTTPNAGKAPHFLQYVENLLPNELGENLSYINGDLTVQTTLDLSVQQKADDAIANGLPKIGRGANNAALVMLDPNSGDILAMVGSANYYDDSIAGQYNIVTGERRPGSSFKPYVYETGFMNGTLKPDSMLDDTQQESQQLGGVQDFDRQYQGKITAEQALIGSRNIATEQAANQIGMQNIINFAYSLGLDPNKEPIADNLSSAIGTSAVEMLDHTAAYAAFANGGYRVAPRAILKVTDAQGNVLIDHTHDITQLGQPMSAQDAWAITSILRKYASRWGLRFKYDTAGKSGTTDNFVDAWYMVYTPSWVIATWAGHTSGTSQAEVGMDGVYGTTEGQYIAVPFVNSLSPPAPFNPAGALPGCSQDNQAFGCATPTPSPTETPTATPTPLPVSLPPTLTPTPTPTPAPTASGAAN